MEDRPFPSGVDSGYDPPYGVVQENRDAVGGPHAYGDPGKGGDQGIVPLQIRPPNIPTVHYGNLASVDLVSLNDGIRQRGTALRTESLGSGSEVISEQLRKFHHNDV